MKVFVIIRKYDNHILGICADWGLCQKHKDLLKYEKGWEESDLQIDEYHVIGTYPELSNA